METKYDYSNVSFANNGKLKLLIIVGTRPEIIRLAAVINKCRTPDKTTTTTSMVSSFATSSWPTLRYI